jgi:hypothetical protein
MIGLRRRTVTGWFRCQSKFTVMFDSGRDRFCIRDVKNNISIGAFTTWDDALEWVFNMDHDTLDGSHE